MASSAHICLSAQRANKLFSMIVVLAMTTLAFMPLADSDPVMVDIGPYEKGFVWDFDNPDNYTLSNTRIQNGSLTLSSYPVQLALTSESDFMNGTLVGLDASSMPGSLMLARTMTERQGINILLDEYNASDSYITNRTPSYNFGSDDLLVVGNDDLLRTYRSLLRLDSYAIYDLPWDAENVSASLSLYKLAGDSMTIHVHLGPSSWSEGEGRWDGVIAVIWVNETESVRRINEPVIVRLDLPGGRDVTDPDRHLILFNGTGSEHPSRILSNISEEGRLLSLELGFPVSCGPLGSERFELRLMHEHSPLPDYRNRSTAYSLLGRLSVGSTLSTPVVADLNGDYRLDLIVYDSSSKRIYAYNHDLALLWSHNVGEDLVYSLTVADIDMDQKPEILYTVKDDGLRILNSTGALIFNYRDSYGGGDDGIGQPAVADLDLDGLPEIIFLMNGGKLTVLNGTDRSLLWQTDLPNDGTAIAVGDITPDHGLEIAAALSDGNVIVFDRNGNERWRTRPSNNPYGSSFALAGIDDDGYLDIVVGEDAGGGKVHALKGLDGSLLWSFGNSTLRRFGDGLAVADLNNDGRNETIALARDSNQIIAISSNGSLLWSHAVLGSTRGAISLADYDGDGLLDIFYGAENGYVYVINGSGVTLDSIFASPDSRRIRTLPLFADLTGNGTLEMVTCSETTLSVYEISGFSSDWRMRARNDRLESTVSSLNSPDGRVVLGTECRITVPPEMPVNWTHATEAEQWVSPGGDFDTAAIDTVLVGSDEGWVTLDATAMIYSWLASGRASLPALYIVPAEAEGLVMFASSESMNDSWHGWFDLTYDLTRYGSTGTFLSEPLGHTQRSLWTTLELNCSLHAGTAVTVGIRSGNSSNPEDGTWGGWTDLAVPGNDSALPISERGRYVQLRLLLSTDNSSFTPIVHHVTVSGIRYNEWGYLETEDVFPEEGISQWNLAWTVHEAGTGLVALKYSTKEGVTWLPVPPSGDISSADKSTGRIRLRIELTAEYADSTPVVFNATVTYLLYTSPSSPPYISPEIPDQTVYEDSPPWTVDLSPHLHDDNDPQSMLRWYCLNKSFLTVYGENITGNMDMTLFVPKNLNGEIVMTLVLVDSDGLETTQDIRITVIPVNDPPTIARIADFSVHYDIPYEYDFSPYVDDIDTPKAMLSLTCVGEGAPYVTFDGLKGIFLLPKSLLDQEVEFTIVVDDGELQSSTTFRVLVLDNHVPYLKQKLPDVEIHQGESRYAVFNLSDFFGDLENDTLLFVSGNIHTLIVINQQTKMVDFHGPIDWHGTELVVFKAIDPYNARVEDAINVTVLRVAQPPTVEEIPDLVVKYSAAYSLDLGPYVYDPDTPLDELHFSTNLSEFISFSKGVMTVMFPSAEFDGMRFQVLLTVTDGEFTSQRSFNITVGQNSPPVCPFLPDHQFVEDRPVPYPIDGSLRDFFWDMENGTDLTYSVKMWTSNVTGRIFASGESVSIVFAQTPNWFGETRMTVRGTDYHGAFVERTVSLIVISENDPPEMLPLGSVNVTAGIETVLDISDKIYDVETPVDMLLLRSNMSEYVHGMAGKLYLRFPENFTGRQQSVTVHVEITVRDLDGGEAAETLIVVVHMNPNTVDDQRIYIWWLFVLIGASMALLAFFLVSRLLRGPFVIRDIFLIHNTGLLLARSSRSESVRVDDDIFSGMLTAVLDFVEDAFEQGDDVMKRFDFKEYSVVLQRGANSYLAMAYSGHPPANLDKMLSEFVTKIERIYGKRIERYSGDAANELRGIEILFNEFLHGR